MNRRINNTSIYLVQSDDNFLSGVRMTVTRHLQMPLVLHLYEPFHLTFISLSRLNHSEPKKSNCHLIPRQVTRCMCGGLVRCCYPCMGCKKKETGFVGIRTLSFHVLLAVYYTRTSYRNVNFIYGTFYWLIYKKLKHKFTTMLLVS